MTTTTMNVGDTGQIRTGVHIRVAYHFLRLMTLGVFCFLLVAGFGQGTSQPAPLSNDPLATRSRGSMHLADATPFTVELSAINLTASECSAIPSAVSSSTGSTYKRNWKQDSLVPFVDPRLSRSTTLGSGTRGLFENTVLVVPQEKASSQSGAVLFSMGHTDEVWTGAFTAFTDPAGRGTVARSGALSTCPAVSLTRKSLAMLLNGSGVTLAQVGFGSNDNQIARLADGSLLLIRQAVITGSPNGSASSQKRGAELVFKSTTGGASWTYVAVIDPFDPAFAGGRYGNPDNQGGFDRIELCVPPTGNTVFLSLTGTGKGSCNGLIFASTRTSASPWGSKWTLVVTDLPATAPFTTTASSEYLFVFNLQDGRRENYDAYVRWYRIDDLLNSRVRPGQFRVASQDGFSLVQSPIVISVGATFAGQKGPDSYVRVYYPHVESEDNIKREVLRTHVVKVTGDKASLVEGCSKTLSALSSGGSLLGAVAVETDRLDLPTSNPTTVSLLYWTESTQTDQSGKNSDNWGILTVRGRIVRDLATWSEPFTLSLEPNGRKRGWSGFALTGHYNKGAFFLDPRSGARKLRFLAQWLETSFVAGAVSRYDLHTNIVSVEP